MPEPNEAGPSTPTAETASAQPEARESRIENRESVDNKPTTTQPHAEGNAVTKDMMNALGIPEEIQSQISRPEQPEAVPTEEREAEAEQPEADAGDTPAATDEAEGEEDEQEQEQEHEHEHEQEERPEAELSKAERKLLKRNRRLTRQKSDLETALDRAHEEAETLRTQLAEKDKAQPAQQHPEIRLGRMEGQVALLGEETATAYRELATERAKAQSLSDWCTENAQGAQTGEGEKAEFISPETVAGWKREADKVIAETGPQIAVIESDARKAVREQKTKFDTAARQAYPELFDPNSGARQTADAIEKQYPWLKDLPDRNFVLGVYLEGLVALQKRVDAANAANGNGNGAQRSDRPTKARAIDPRAFEPRVPIAPSTPEAPTREVVPSSRKKFNQTMTDLVTEGGRDNLIAAMAAMDELNAPIKPPSQRLVKS